MEMAILFCLVVAFSSKSAVPDVAAALKGNPVPSHERKMERLRAKGHDTSTQPRPRTVRDAMQATVRNAAERAAIKREAKHSAKRTDLEDRKDDITAEKYHRLKSKHARKQAAVSRYVKARGLVTGHAKAAVNTVRERRAEDAAWQENERRDREHPHDTDDTNGSAKEDTDQRDATILEFTRGPGQDEISVSDGGSSNVRGDPGDPSTWTGTDSAGRDIQTGRGPSSTEVDENGRGGVVHDHDLLLTNVSPERRIVLQHQRQHEQDSTGDVNRPTTPQEATTMTTNGSSTTGEINGLVDAQNYTSSVHSYLNKIGGVVEPHVADFNHLSKQVADERQSAELAAASLRGKGMLEVASQIEQANEQLGMVQQAFEQAAHALAGLPDSITTASSAYGRAHQALVEQSGIAEQVQAANGSGNRVARDTNFYANA